MKRKLISACFVTLCLASLTLAKEKKPKPGPLTGTWDCISHGGPQGDMPFTLHLEQNKDAVTGSVESPMGGTEITSATFKKQNLEIQINTSQGNYHLTGKLNKGQLAGLWDGADQKGTWQGKKATQTKP